MTDDPSTGGAATAADAAAPSDEALLARVAARDRAAFATLFLRHAGRVKGFVMRAGFSAAEADEAAQEVMLAVWRRAGTFDPARSAGATWIYAVARNRRVDMLRRRRPEPDPEDPHFNRGAEPPADAAVGIAARDRALRAALAALPPEQIDAVRLTFFDGLSHTEAAEALGLPLGTLKSRLRLAMTRLRGALGPDFAQELQDD